MKQFGLAFAQYTQDYDEYLPVGVEPNNTTGTGLGGQIFPYVKSSQIFACPSDGTQPQTDTAPKKSKISYAINSVVIANPARIGVSAADRAITRFNATAKTVMLMEVSGINATVDAGQENGSGTTPSTAGLDQRLFLGDTTFLHIGAFSSGFLGGRSGTIGAANGNFESQQGRHLEGSNFLLADGHVKWFKGDNVSSGWMAASSTGAQSGSGPTAVAAGTENSSYAVTFSPM